MQKVTLPERALTVRQPWAWAIMAAGKNIENRNWPTNFRGRVAIHAAKGMRYTKYLDACTAITDARGDDGRDAVPAPYNMAFGAIIGTVEIVDCVSNSDSPWFMGPYGFVLRDPQPLKVPIHCKGALGFWQIPSEIREAVNG